METAATSTSLDSGPNKSAGVEMSFHAGQLDPDVLDHVRRLALDDADYAAARKMVMDALPDCTAAEADDVIKEIEEDW